MTTPLPALTASVLMRAHQFLYYVEANPVWSDFDYDRFCSANGLFGGGGSDSARDYSLDIQALALAIKSKPSGYPPTLLFDNA